MGDCVSAFQDLTSDMARSSGTESCALETAYAERKFSEVAVMSHPRLLKMEHLVVLAVRDAFQSFG